MANPFVHVELNTTDLGRAKKFYRALFDWKLSDMPMPQGTYTMVDVGEGTGGGMMDQLIPNAASAWMPYVLVDDIESATAKAEKLGAKICKGVTEVQDMGWLSIFEDPTGALIGLWKPKPRPRSRAKRSNTTSAKSAKPTKPAKTTKSADRRAKRR